jgi:hypothetical protein
MFLESVTTVGSKTMTSCYPKNEEMKEKKEETSWN